MVIREARDQECEDLEEDGFSNDEKEFRKWVRLNVNENRKKVRGNRGRELSGKWGR